jgi:hypothetical protein
LELPTNAVIGYEVFLANKDAPPATAFRMRRVLCTLVDEFIAKMLSRIVGGAYRRAVYVWCPMANGSQQLFELGSLTPKHTPVPASQLMSKVPTFRSTGIVGPGIPDDLIKALAFRVRSPQAAIDLVVRDLPDLVRDGATCADLKTYALPRFFTYALFLDLQTGLPPSNFHEILNELSLPWSQRKYMPTQLQFLLDEGTRVIDDLYGGLDGSRDN